jgi:hypothetical protein
MNNSEIKKTLFHPRTKKNIYLAQLKVDSDYSTFKIRTKGVIQHPFGKSAILANPLPKSYEKLRSNNIIPHSGNIESEIAWLIYSITENAQLLNEFISLKNKYEFHYILNEYEKAEQILNEVENKICFSYWGAENRILLAQEKTGIENNWLILDEFSKKVKDPLSLFLLQQSSKKAESNFSYIRYKDNFESIIQGTQEFLHEYLCFKAIYPAYTGFQNYSFLINVESISSIIDRYILLIDVLIELISKNKTNFVLQVTEDLIDKILNDIRLIQIKNILSKEKIKIQGREDLIKYIDQYSLGNYKSCIESAFEIIKKYPTSIELFVIYVKSLIEEQLVFKQTNISENIDDILQKLYNVFVLNEDFSSSIEGLLKITLKCFSSNWSKQLFGVVSEHAKLSNENYLHQFYHLINSEFNNSKILNYINILGQDNLISSFDFYKDFNSISAEINVNINEGNYQIIKENQAISDKRKDFYIAQALSNANKPLMLVEHLEAIARKEQHSIVTVRDIIGLLFNNYIKEGKSEAALLLYVKSFFKNQNLVHRLDNEKLLNRINKNETLKPIPSIDLAIFYFISTSDVYEQYVKYDEFLESKQIERPTQLINDTSIPEEKIKFFLKEICNIELMHHSLYFEGTDDIENERILLLKHLLVIDKINEADYIKEITDITQKSKIRKAIREVNKGRITINTQLLKNKEENNIKDNFLRYKDLVVFSNTHNLKSIDPTSKMLNEYFNSLEDKSVRDKVVNINDPAFISFKSMFLDLRDKFILSKDFGLDGYLSTRIRHGTFLNHIRSIFESFNLISQKRNEEYEKNVYWFDKTPHPLECQRDEIQKAIKEFSKQIDDFTEYIIKELIQVKSEKHTQHQNAFFDFSLNDTALAYLFKDSKDRITTHSTFLDYVFDNLEALIDIRLKETRAIFQQGIKDNYTKIIDDFENRIREIIGIKSFVDLTNSIVKCKTNIQTELDNISEWFNVSNPSSDNLLDFETIIKTAVEITNTIYPQNQINPVIIVDNDIVFVGGVNIIYLIRILLDNIIKHSKLQDSNYNSKIQVDISNNNSLKLSISNNFDKRYRDEIIQKLNLAKKKWSNNDDFSKSNIEGGSGLDKIRRILSVDMKMNNYSFDFQVKENHLVIFIIMEIQIYENKSS